MHNTEITKQMHDKIKKLYHTYTLYSKINNTYNYFLSSLILF